MGNFGTTTQRIHELLDEFFRDSDMFLVEVRELPKDRIQVVVDSDSGLSIDTCAKISRHLEHHLEAEELVSEHYNLEVTSPGVGKPLKMYRQYPKNIGRKVEVTLVDDTKVTGVLKQVDEETLEIEPERKKKKGGGGKNQVLAEPQRILFDQIKETKVLVSF